MWTRMGLLLAVLWSNLLFDVFMLPVFDETKPFPTTCDAGEVTVNRTARITCYFSTDIRQSAFMVSILHFQYEFTNGKLKETDVLTCAQNILGELQCHIHDGYGFNYNITDELTVTIPIVTLNHAGIYLCQVLPEQAPPETCTLNVTLADNTTANPPTATLENGTKTSQNETGLESVQQGSTATIFAVVFTLSFCVQTIGIVVFCCIKRRKSRSRPLKTSTSNNDMAEEKELKGWLGSISEIGPTDSGDKSPPQQFFYSGDEII